MFIKKAFASILFIVATCLSVAHAQFQDDLEVEALYDQHDQEEQRRQRPERPRDGRAAEPTRLSELSELAPFTDIAVISRRYLPKTGRFEIAASAAMVLNNAYFNNVGATARFSYYFTEKLGIEGMYFTLNESQRAITENLEKKVTVAAYSLVTPKSFAGLSFKWVPIYGKMSLLNEKIVPFDIYFAPGVGKSTTANGSYTTVHLGTGQTFAISKAMAVRWDLAWNFYSAEVDQKTGGTTEKVTKNHSDLFISLGMSFYFPEAKYR